MQEDKRKIVLFVTILRKKYPGSYFELDRVIGVPSKLRRPTCLSLFRKTQVDSGLVKSFFSNFRAILLSLSRYPKMYIPFRFLSLKVEFQVPESPRVMTLSIFRNGAQIPTYVMREAASVGIRIPELDLSYEYEFRRNINHYESFVTSGISISDNPKLQGINTFCDGSNMKSGVGANTLTLNGLLANPSEWVPVSGHNNWSSQEIPEAQVLHGRVIVSQGNFIFTDSSRIPSFSSTTVMPFLVRQTQFGKFETPFAVSNLPKEDEAIFIGGTNNFMHFVLEDLPRLVLADKMGLSKEIPILLRSGLSRQILETIAAISGRRQIPIGTFEEIKVCRLYAFKFTNCLPEVMSGSETAADNLIDPELLLLARQKIRLSQKDSPIDKILIVREKGLFRPLTNSKRIQLELRSHFGFEIAELSHSNFENASFMFINAQLIVGEYGAGLANMIFAKGPTTVIEIRGPLEEKALEYRALSHACGFNHIFLVGKSRKVSKFGVSRGPFKISIKTLENAISSAIRSFL